MFYECSSVNRNKQPRSIGNDKYNTIKITIIPFPNRYQLNNLHILYMCRHCENKIRLKAFLPKRYEQEQLTYISIGLRVIGRYSVIFQEEAQFVELTVPFIIVSKSTEHTESDITFTALSTDSDNMVLSSEKENCTHGIICRYPSTGFCPNEQSLQRVQFIPSDLL